jgi:hypothetical protein
MAPFCARVLLSTRTAADEEAEARRMKRYPTA